MIKLGVLDCGEMPSEWVEEHGTFAQWFTPFLNKASSTIDYQSYEVYRGQLPARADECSAWLITGSADSVYDDIDWLNALKDFIRLSVKQVPIVGICFGHQLLHEVLGGKVERSDKGWCIGAHHYEVNGQASWIQPEVASFDLLASHQDQVMIPAPDSQTLASSANCPVAMSAFGDYAISMQPHPELLVDLAELVFSTRRDEQGHEVTDEALASLKTPLDDQLAARWIVNFLEESTVTSKNK